MISRHSNKDRKTTGIAVDVIVMGEPRDSIFFDSDASLHSPGGSDLHHRVPFDVDAPTRFSVAAKFAFPDGSMTASGLRREAARGLGNNGRAALFIDQSHSVGGVP